MFIKLMTQRDIDRIREEEREKIRYERFMDDRIRDIHMRIDSIANRLQQLDEELHPPKKADLTACACESKKAY